MTGLSGVAPPIDQAARKRVTPLPAAAVPAAAAAAPGLPARPDMRRGRLGAARRAGGRIRTRLAGDGVRTRWWVEALIVAWLLWVYDAVNNFAPLRLGPALAHGRALLNFESSLGIAPERGLDRWLSGHHTLGLLVADYYDNAHFIVTLGVLGFLWWRRADIFRPLRSALVVMNVLGFVVFWLYPVAPPRMLAGFTDVVAETGAIGSWHDGTLASSANQLAAMPSLHCAWAVWCGVALWRISGRAWVRALAVAYPLLTSFAVLATGNHYVLDILAGVAVAAAAHGLVAAVGRRGAPA